MIYHKLMREVWVPYVLAEPCLLSVVFHVACRNYLIVAKNHDDSNRFEIKMLEYRAKCLNNASKAIESKAAATDTIIALALVMASESVSETNPLSQFLLQLTSPLCSTLLVTLPRLLLMVVLWPGWSEVEVVSKNSALVAFLGGLLAHVYLIPAITWWLVRSSSSISDR